MEFKELLQHVLSTTVDVGTSRWYLPWIEFEYVAHGAAISQPSLIDQLHD